MVSGGAGVSSWYSDNIVLENIHSSDNFDGILLYQSNNSEIIDSELNNNRESGLSVSYGDGNKIHHSIIDSSKANGIAVCSSNFSAYNNTLSNSFYSGIYSSNCATPNIHNNNFINNSGDDIGAANVTFAANNDYYSKNTSCVDADVDGFCDSPYQVSQNVTDSQPLRNPIDLQAHYIVSFGQYTEDGAIVIPEGGLVNNDAVTIKATVSSPIGGSLRLQAEVIDTSSQFTGNPTNASGSNETEIRIKEIKDGSYRWRVRVFDETNNKYSSWSEFGIANNTDFSVNYPLTFRAIKQAHSAFGAPYLGDGATWGGKGWDQNNGGYVSSTQIKDGYYYYDARYDAARWGEGLDCSGLSSWSYNRSYDPIKNRLYNAIHDENAQGQFSNSANTYAVSEAEKQPGDLLFLSKNGTNQKGHVGIYSGNLVPNVEVVESNISFGIGGSQLSDFKTYQGYIFNPNEDIRRVNPNPQIAAIIQATSTVDMVIANPEGIIISTKSEKKQKSDKVLKYSRDDKNKEVVYWDDEKNGKYKISIIPKDNVSLNKIFSLEIAIKGKKNVLLDNIPLNKIAKKGYTLYIENNKAVLAENQ